MKKEKKRTEKSGTRTKRPFKKNMKNQKIKYHGNEKRRAAGRAHAEWKKLCERISYSGK